MSDRIDVGLVMDRLGNLRGRVLDDTEHNRIVKDMVTNGADLDAISRWPLFVQGYTEAMETMASLDMDVDPESVELEQTYMVETSVDRWAFRHACGYCND